MKKQRRRRREKNQQHRLRTRHHQQRHLCMNAEPLCFLISAISQAVKETKKSCPAALREEQQHRSFTMTHRLHQIMIIACTRPLSIPLLAPLSLAPLSLHHFISLLIDTQLWSWVLKLSDQQCNNYNGGLVCKERSIQHVHSECATATTDIAAGSQYSSAPASPCKLCRSCFSLFSNSEAS